MFKKIVCAAIMTALLVSQAVCVLADEPTRSVATTTTYADGQVEVTTTVSGVETDDEITYLAYTGTDVTDDSIAYIDQKTVTTEDAGTVTFKYVADFKFNGSKVMVGGLNKSANAAFAVDDTGEIKAELVVTIESATEGESAKSYPIAPVDKATGLTKIEGVAVGGEKLLDVDGKEVTWFAAADGIWVDNGVLNGKTAVTLKWDGTFETVDAPVLGAVKNIKAKLLVLATKSADAKDYGILVSKAAFDTEDIETYDALEENYVEDTEDEETPNSRALTAADLDKVIIRYAALGTDADGNYVVAVENLLADGETYNVAAYSIDADGETITDVKSLTAVVPAE